MNAAMTSMEPLSVRIPGDLYLWLAQLQIDGATTNSDKLRILLGQLKRQYDGAFDYTAAHGWARDMTGRVREALVRIEGQGGRHSEVVSAILESSVATLALLVSNAPGDEGAAMKLEEALVKRAFALSEALLRQAATQSANAFDPGVVRRHMPVTIEIATAINTLKGS